MTKLLDPALASAIVAYVRAHPDGVTLTDIARDVPGAPDVPELPSAIPQVLLIGRFEFDGDMVRCRPVAPTPATILPSPADATSVTQQPASAARAAAAVPDAALAGSSIAGPAADPIAAPVTDRPSARHGLGKQLLPFAAGMVIAAAAVAAFFLSRRTAEIAPPAAQATRATALAVPGDAPARTQPAASAPESPSSATRPSSAAAPMGAAPAAPTANPGDSNASATAASGVTFTVPPPPPQPAAEPPPATAAMPDDEPADPDMDVPATDPSPPPAVTTPSRPRAGAPAGAASTAPAATGPRAPSSPDSSSSVPAATPQSDTRRPQPLPPFPTASGAYVLSGDTWVAMPKGNLYQTTPQRLLTKLLELHFREDAAAGQVNPPPKDIIGEVAFEGTDRVPVVPGAAVVVAYVGEVAPAAPENVKLYKPLADYPILELVRLQLGDSGMRYAPFYLVGPGTIGVGADRVEALIEKAAPNVTLLRVQRPLGAGRFGLCGTPKPYELEVK